MRYFAINLEDGFEYDYSGRSINVKPMRHIARTLRNYELFFVLSGQLWIRQESELCVSDGEICMHVKNARQEGTKYAENDFYWLHFDGQVLASEDYEYIKGVAEQDKKWIFFAEKFKLKEPSRISVIMSLINHYAFGNEGDTVKNYLAKALLTELANQYAATVLSEGREKRFDEILTFIARNVNSDITISALAEKFSYNPKYLSALFRKNTGMTAREYITDKKIDYAKHLLVSTTLAVKAVAKETGFDDEYYFMRTFKKKVGITPKNYRKTYSGCSYT